MKALLVAEKPSLMRDIKAVYEKMNYPDDIKFVSLRGHIMRLKEPEEYMQEWGRPWNEKVLPMIPKKFEYVVAVPDIFKEIERELNTGNYDYVINACDAGREGQAIFESVYNKIGKTIPVKRFWASDTTADTIKNALNNLLNSKDKTLMALSYSARLRSCFDWLLGMNLSRAISLQTGTPIAIGRVMTPTLNIVVKREMEIKNFIEKKYYEIEADFNKYKGIWFDKNTKDTKIENEKKANGIINQLPKDGLIENIEKKKEVYNAPTLHSLLELQKEANDVYGYTADKTLDIAQSLYEKRKAISYPRTDSRFLPQNIIKEIPDRLKTLLSVSELNSYVNEVLKSKNDINKILSTKRYVNDAGVTDHHAIIPTKNSLNLNNFSQDEINIYLLVAKRFLSIFLKPNIIEKTIVITKLDEEKFKTIGKRIIDLGYKVLYRSNNNDVILPDLKIGERVTIKKCNLLEKKTTPPQRYSDSSLLQAMQNPGKLVSDEELRNILKETAGLGTSATRAGIIKKLIKRKMIERKGKSFYATTFGINIIKILNNKEIIMPELTANWEKKLLEVEELKYNPISFYKEMIEYTTDCTKDILKIKTSFHNIDKKIVGVCPKCGANVIIGKSYYLCENYKKKCNFIIGKTIYGAAINKNDIKNLLNNEKTSTKTFLWKTGNKGKASLIIKDDKSIGFLF